MKRNFYYQLLGMTGSNKVSYEDAEKVYSIRLFARKHKRQAENSCNGYGIVKGQMYYTGTIDDYARREYGLNVKDGNKGEVNVFDIEYDRIADKIRALLPKGFTVDFQGDPRGYTVRLSYKGKDITELIQD